MSEQRLRKWRRFPVHGELLLKEMKKVARIVLECAFDGDELPSWTLRDDPLVIRAILELAEEDLVEYEYESYENQWHNEERLYIARNPTLEKWYIGESEIAVPLTTTEDDILEVLYESRVLLILNTLLQNVQSCEDRKTLSKYLRRLNSRGFVHQPNGVRGGWAITEAGREFLQRRRNLAPL